MRIAKNNTILLVVLFAAAAVVRAQTSAGEVNGTVTDNSGGAISGAAVKLTNQGTNVTKEGQTNANGYFVFINVLPGSYVLTVEKQGFKTAQVSGFDMQVNQTLTQNIRLDVGAISESVTVSAEAPLLQFPRPRNWGRSLQKDCSSAQSLFSKGNAGLRLFVVLLLGPGALGERTGATLEHKADGQKSYLAAGMDPRYQLGRGGGCLFGPNGKLRRHRRF